MQVRFVIFTLLSLPTVAWAGEPSLQDFTNSLSSPSSPVPVVIYRAKEIVTLDPARPSVQAVAVAGDQILATGSLVDVKAAAGSRPCVLRGERRRPARALPT